MEAKMQRFVDLGRQVLMGLGVWTVIWSGINLATGPVERCAPLPPVHRLG